MPELPEVETIVRKYSKLLSGQKIAAFESRWPRQVSPDYNAVKTALPGLQINNLSRRAKFIVMHLSNNSWLLVHLRMSGRFEWLKPGESEPAHVRALWTFESGEQLLFCDARKFGRIIYTSDFAAATAGIGIEPLERSFTAARLGDILHSHSRTIKTMLLDQSLIAGLGNIYTDESLHMAGIHPARRSDGISDEEVLRLHGAIKTVLKEAIRHNGTSFDWIYPDGHMQDNLKVYGRKGEPCRSCGGIIERTVTGQRGTHFCPRCQPLK